MFSKLSVTFKAPDNFKDFDTLRDVATVLATDTNQIIPWFDLITHRPTELDKLPTLGPEFHVSGCQHTFETFTKQDRAGDEAFTAYIRCTKCSIIKKMK